MNAQQQADLFAKPGTITRRPKRQATGQQLKRAGMKATEEAERAAWFAIAIGALRTFLRRQGDKPFKAEEFRMWWAGRASFVAPHNHYVWGAFWRMVESNGMVADTRERAPATSPKTHGHQVRVLRGCW